MRRGFSFILIILLAAIAGFLLLKRRTPETSVIPVEVVPERKETIPMVSEARPTPPLKTTKKPILKPVTVQKEPLPAKKPVSQAPNPPPAPVTFVPVLPPVPALPPPQEWQGTDTAVTHVGQVVIRNDRQWVQFWAEHRPHEAAPDIDFAQHMVIGVFAGPRPAEQFSISIVAIRSLPGSLVVDYRERLPPPGTFAVNVTVYPYQIKVVPRSSLPVKFNVLSPENVVR